MDFFGSMSVDAATFVNRIDRIVTQTIAIVIVHSRSKINAMIVSVELGQLVSLPISDSTLLLVSVIN
jgi:hypothetical protein